MIAAAERRWEAVLCRVTASGRRRGAVVAKAHAERVAGGTTEGGITTMEGEIGSAGGVGVAAVVILVSDAIRVGIELVRSGEGCGGRRWGGGGGDGAAVREDVWRGGVEGC